MIEERNFLNEQQSSRYLETFEISIDDLNEEFAFLYKKNNFYTFFTTNVSMILL